MKLVKEIANLVLWVMCGAYLGYTAGYMYDTHIVKGYFKSEGIMESICSKPLSQLKERAVIAMCTDYLKDSEKKIGDDMVKGK